MHTLNLHNVCQIYFNLENVKSTFGKETKSWDNPQESEICIPACLGAKGVKWVWDRPWRGRFGHGHPKPSSGCCASLHVGEDVYGAYEYLLLSYAG